MFTQQQRCREDPVKEKRCREVSYSSNQKESFVSMAN